MLKSTTSIDLRLYLNFYLHYTLNSCYVILHLPMSKNLFTIKQWGFLINLQVSTRFPSDCQPFVIYLQFLIRSIVKILFFVFGYNWERDSWSNWKRNLMKTTTKQCSTLNRWPIDSKCSWISVIELNSKRNVRDLKHNYLVSRLWTYLLH